MQFPPDVTKPINESLFDMHVDVFQLHTKREFSRRDFLSDPVQLVDQSGALLAGYQTHVRQHVRMGDRADDIVSVQPLIEADAFGKSVHTLVG